MRKALYNFHHWLIKTRLSIVLFWPLAILYYCGFILRKLFYKSGIKKGQSLPCQVISIGNLTWGGTGKTPLVDFIAQRFRSKKIVVLSRGYARPGKKEKIILVSDRNHLLAEAKEAGDEAYLLARRLPGVPVVTGADRLSSGKWAFNRFQPEVIILDDGFQHWAVKRNLDLVVIDSANPFGNGWLIPAGILREPRTELKRAQIIFLSKVNEAKMEVDHLKKKIKKFNSTAPIIETVFEPLEFSFWPEGETRAKEFIQKKPVFMLAGLASPASFRSSLLQLGGNLVGEALYPDHYWYQSEDLTEVIKSARFKKAEFIITTEKDKVKLPRDSLDFPILILKAKIKVVKGEETLDAWLS